MRPKSCYRHMNQIKADEIRRRYFSREATQVELAKQYGMRQSSISRIVSGLVWDNRLIESSYKAHRGS